MNGGIYVIIGTRGTGKSTFVKKLISPVHKSRLLIYDVNNEYYNDPQYKPPPMDEFLEDANNRKESVIVLEESTIFFSSHGNDRQLRELMVRSRHTKNTLIFVFHSIADLPPYIYRLINTIILFKTLDSKNLIWQKLSSSYMVEKFHEVQKNKNKHFHLIFNPL